MSSMADEGVFSGNDPIEILKRWMAEASETEPNDPNAMTLATVDDNGLPNARIVLLKQFEESAVVFFTNYESKKSIELEAAGEAAFLLYWKTLGRQIRGRGRVSRIDAEASDAYYRSRPLDSRLGAWASAQSRPLESRQALMDEVERMRKRFGDEPPRPPHWGGFRISPIEMEFWANGEFRLHDRFRWTRADAEKQWAVERLCP